jgi:hypothetical protein
MLIGVALAVLRVDIEGRLLRYPNGKRAWDGQIYGVLWSRLFGVILRGVGILGELLVCT